MPLKEQLLQYKRGMKTSIKEKPYGRMVTFYESEKTSPLNNSNQI